MATVTSAEFQKNFGTYKDAAQRGPVTITNHGRESLVVLSADEYKRLKSMDTRQAYFAHEIPEDMLAEIDAELERTKDIQPAEQPELKF